MIEGHGDDAYKYKDIRSDFSSNICAHGSHHGLLNHLAAHPELIDHYPEPEAWSLEKMLAAKHDIDPRQVIVTSGATEAIYLIAQTFRLNAIIPEPTFSEYAEACMMYNLPCTMYNFRDGKQTNAHPSSLIPATVSCGSLLSKASQVPSAPQGLLWLCNPNNPTGEVYDRRNIERMIAEHEIVVIDQSYANYTDASVMSPQEGCMAQNVIQIHSITKDYGVPGLRLGYITAHDRLTEQIRQYMRPWSVSALAIEAGKYLLQHDELICRPDLQEAQRLREKLNQIKGIEVMPTKTNFMLCRLEHHTAAELKEYLACEHHILIRDASNFKGLTPHHFRVASQTAEENDALVRAIEGFMDEGGWMRVYG
ncbi:MAG: pyridoxal phosphate-dependent class II aminotransferase [Prevotella sp.]|nr:pyridoxal phosphate-dependent class II aminotransferase [Prevotella sp.]